MILTSFFWSPTSKPDFTGLLLHPDELLHLRCCPVNWHWQHCSHTSWLKQPVFTKQLPSCVNVIGLHVKCASCGGNCHNDGHNDMLDSRWEILPNKICLILWNSSFYIPNRSSVNTETWIDLTHCKWLRAYSSKIPWLIVGKSPHLFSVSLSNSCMCV